MVDKMKSSNDSNKSNNKNNYVVLKINSIITMMFIAILAVVIVAIFISKFQYGKTPDFRYINIEGEAEREIIADMAEWSLYFEHVGEKQSDLNKKISAEKPRVFEFLVNNGINKEEIEFFNYIKEDYYDKKNHKAIRYRMGYCVRIKTKKIEIVSNLKNNLSELFSEDIGIVRNILEVSCSKQAEVEQELYKEAVKNALDKASDLTQFLKIKLRKILKVETPRFYKSSLVPNVDMAGGYNRLMAVFQNAEESASKEMMKRKVKANVSVQVGIR